MGVHEDVDVVYICQLTPYHNTFILSTMRTTRTAHVAGHYIHFDIDIAYVTSIAKEIMCIVIYQASKLSPLFKAF